MLGKKLNSDIVADFSETLLEVSVDNLMFRVAWHPALQDHCILWFKDELTDNQFEALGRFSNFEKRILLEFITRFSTSIELRKHISLKKFEKKLESLSPKDLKVISMLPAKARESAFKNLYNLDSAMEHCDIAKKRKLMAKRFHPDAGGDNGSMTVINEAYDYLVSHDCV